MVDKLLKKTDLSGLQKGKNERQQMKPQQSGRGTSRAAAPHRPGGSPVARISCFLFFFFPQWINFLKSHSCLSFSLIISWPFKTLSI